MRLAREISLALLRKVRAGHIELQESFPGGARLEFGPASAELSARVTLHDPDVYRRLVRSKSIALGETYAEGLWEADDLLTLLRIASRDIPRADPIRRRLADPRRHPGRLEHPHGFERVLAGRPAGDQGVEADDEQGEVQREVAACLARFVTMLPSP